ncbi:MAG TPA: hypothetical protein PK185_15870 [Cyclobacteriaceae bacterium]|nr:hypothetical protein [Cyclobacteriaceae bacterium]
MRVLLLVVGLSTLIHESRGQILFSESFTVILDSTKQVQGSVTPELKIQTQKKTLIEITNMADLSIKVKKNYFSVANKVEFTSFGGEVFLSGGYLFMKFKNDLNKHFTVEYFGQVHWAEARGMERKYAGGVYARIKIVKNAKTGLFIGVGPFYELEKWNYDGVIDERLPINVDPIDTLNLKIGSYISFKHWIWDRIFLDISVYHQSRFDQVFDKPRMASSSRIGYQISEHLQFVAMYQNIHDYSPIVPIDKWFHRAIGTISISF